MKTTEFYEGRWVGMYDELTLFCTFMARADEPNYSQWRETWVELWDIKIYKVNERNQYAY